MQNGCFGIPPGPLAGPQVPGTVLIAQVVVAAPVAAVLFPSVPGSFIDLILSIYGRTDNAVTSQGVVLQMGSGSVDVGANYYWQYVQGSSTATGAGDGLGQTSIALNNIPGASATAGRAGIIHVQVIGYASTALQKAIIMTGFFSSGTVGGTGTTRLMGGEWASTTAVDALKVFPASGNFAPGSVVTLWGRS